MANTCTPTSATMLIALLNDVAEFLEGYSDVDDGSYGEQVPNRAMSLLQEVEFALERVKAYQAKNPLGGPATMFRAIAERIEAGEGYYAVLADYGLQVAAPQAGKPDSAVAGQAPAVAAPDGPDSKDLASIKTILQGACDRDWKDEDLYQTAMIVCNAIFWRNQLIEGLREKIRAASSATKHEADNG